MHTFINSPFKIGTLTLPNRLIQGPLAGYSCAPFRELFYQYAQPAYCVSEMSSALDVLTKHSDQSRYLYRSPKEGVLAYQISGNDGVIMAKAALKIQNLGADIIDINCGCPKAKIRKKGAGSALLEQPEKLITIIKTIRERISIPLTVKIRIQGTDQDIALAQSIQEAGADALIVHGRRWVDDYSIASDLIRIAAIKQCLSIPVVANGDISDAPGLQKAIELTGCDAFMLGRAGSGKPWLYQELLEQRTIKPSTADTMHLFMHHLEGLAALEGEHKAVLQSKSLVRYYFGRDLSDAFLSAFYQLKTLEQIKACLRTGSNTGSTAIHL